MTNRLKINIKELNTNEIVVKNFDFFSKPDFYINIITKNQRYSTQVLYNTYNGTFNFKSEFDIDILDIFHGLTIKLELCEKDTNILPNILKSENIIGNAYIETRNLKIDEIENNEISFGENIGTVTYELSYEINSCNTLIKIIKKIISFICNIY